MIIQKRAAATNPAGAGQSGQGDWLQSMTWPEAEQALRRFRVILIPVGACTKEHGLHLPLNTDWLQAEYLARRLVAARPVLAVPTIGYAHYPAFVTYPGSVSLGMAAFQDTLTDLCTSLEDGLDATEAHCFYVLNTGISTLPGLESARRMLARRNITLAYSDFGKLMRDVEQDLQSQPRGSHADEIETSAMLYIAPEQVHMDRAVPELGERLGPGPFCRSAGDGCGLVSPSGAWGDPSAASREQGEVWVEELLRRLCAEVDRLLD